MKLWLISYHHADSATSGWIQEWFPFYTMAACRYDKLRRMVAEGEAGVSLVTGIKELRLPKSKQACCDFLNEWAGNG